MGQKMSFFDAIGGIIELGSAVFEGVESRAAHSAGQSITREGLEVLARADPERAVALAEESAELGRLIANPASPKYRALAGLYESFNRRAAIDAIEDILKANRRDVSRGGPGFYVQPERRDESRSRALLYNFMLGRERANLQAQNALAASSGAVGNAAGRVTTATGLYPEIAATTMGGATGVTGSRLGQTRALADIGEAIGRSIEVLPDEFGLFETPADAAIWT